MAAMLPRSWPSRRSTSHCWSCSGRRETLAVELLTDTLGVEVPSWTEVRVSEGDLGQVDPVETRADLVLLLDERGKPVFGIVVEVQLAKNPDKLLRWPLYAVTLRVRHGCPVAVLVVTPDRAVAAWAAEPIPLCRRRPTPRRRAAWTSWRPP